MTPIAWLIIATVILPLTYFVWSWATLDRKGALAIRGNLARGFTVGGREAGQQAPMLLGISKRLTPGSYEAKLDHWLSLAGRPASMPLDKLIISKPLLSLAGALAGIVVLSNSFTSLNIAVAIFMTVFFYFVPDLLVYNKAIKRQEEIELELPNTLDQMLISVEAGLGFESAMARAGSYGGGPLAQELVRTLQDIQVGRPRHEAYEAMAARTSVPDLKGFVRAVVQADKYGIGIAKVLRAQAKDARVKRRQRAEEKAMKLPVKVLFPLIFFIFPVLFIVLLGPAAINIIEAFSRV
ncbi:type II secretion system F family protein [Pseudarthrobacter sp. NIBRBAC000502770]|uniref:type II secretion system F family protein n=1 Tax=Pseudarthrobacter sp. NIBRBAC000502770 TaxID=2590785 RepID=UPI00113FD7DC|nr:type II secretion system F family protein [Pseudarthrobacter sp. NIBRBAC000502770]QDG89159.1 type II secretion system F family protein [Pseudarthrobacter sp. NIBRBAC000502770]